MIYIGIDPDAVESGYCVYDSETQQIIDFGSKKFFYIADLLKQYKGKSIVIIEGGWLIKKKNWHFSPTKSVAERIAYNVGQNHCVGQLLELFCKLNDIECRVVLPKGKKPISYVRKLTGITGKLNQDICDAIMLVWGAQ